MILAVQICSELEWIYTKSILKIKKTELMHQPFGEYFRHPIGKHQSVFFDSGATKTRSAAACQFAIDKWVPDVVVNLGTSGGVAEDVGRREIILANKTFQYDVIQRFGKPSTRFLRGLKTNIDISWIDLGRASSKIHIGTIASVDQDLDDEHRKLLQKKKVLAADWESASIANICKLNKTRCLILRGVSDVPEKKGRPNEDNQERDYQKNSRIIMKDLFMIIGQIVFG